MINTSIHLGKQKPRFDFSEERENLFGESYRRLAIEVTGIGYVDIPDNETGKRACRYDMRTASAEKKVVILAGLVLAVKGKYIRHGLAGRKDNNLYILRDKSQIRITENRK